MIGCLGQCLCYVLVPLSELWVLWWANEEAWKRGTTLFVGHQKFCEVRGSTTTEAFEGKEQEFKGQPAASEAAWELRRRVERRKLWRSSGELLGRVSVGEGFHNPSGFSWDRSCWWLGPSWIYLLPTLESVWSQDGFTAGTLVHRGLGGGGHQDWIWLRGCTATKRLLWSRGSFLRKDRMCTFPFKVVFLFWNEKSETVSSGKFVFKVQNILIWSISGERTD